MTAIPPLVVVTTRLFPLLLGLLVAMRLLTGNIVTRGLLRDRQTGRVSALRVQMLIATFVAASSYAAAIAYSHSPELPPIDGRLLLLVAGANSLHLSPCLLSRLLKYLKPSIQG